MAQLGVKRGELALFDAAGRPASAALVQSADQRTQVLSGGLRNVLMPLGLTLLQGAGVKRGDAFVLVLDNDRTSVACMLAAMQLQCVCALVGRSRVALLDHVKTHTGITKVLTVHDATTSVDAQDDANPQAAGDATAIPWLEDEEIAKGGCVCMLTSGSVGEPKVVPCTWEHMLLQGESTHQQLFPKGPARIICGTSISHAYSINTIFALLTSPFDAQSELCFASSPVGLYSLLSQRSELFTALYATPGTYTALAAMPQTALYADVPYCAGTRLSLSLFRKMSDDFGLTLMQNYGSTEMGDMAAWYLHGKQFDDELKEMESNDAQLYVGSVWPGVETRTEENGEVTITTPWQSAGYVKEQVLHHLTGAHHTSDLGTITHDSNGVNCVWLQGRLRPSVEVEWQDQRTVYSTKDVEAVISAHPGVSDVLVLIQSEENRKLGIIRTRVVLEDGAAIDSSDLKQWCVDHDMPALREALVIELAKFLPCSPAGKLMYA
ncbi:amp-dependent synthetase and ligase [Phytophthora cinnamomi]|uniref:amp-dependent synthetase and ligase n=1 Tax=Phytophthora cinnamomi TaxID=4785 RepID=UPI003559C007|nr:amp-dependent synthetase and ligase [Phytophthora cinnamomi]